MAQRKINKYLEDERDFLAQYVHCDKEEIKDKLYLEYKKTFSESTRNKDALVQKWYELKKQVNKKKKRQNDIKKIRLGSSKSSLETNQGKLFFFPLRFIVILFNIHIFY